MGSWETAAKRVLRSGQPAAEALLRALDDVNPTGLRLSKEEEDARYAVKAQLQSLLIRLYPEALTLEPGEPYPLLRMGRRDAKHVFVSALEADAAVWCRARMADWEVDAAPAGLVGAGGEAGVRPKMVRRAEVLEEEGRYEEAIAAWLEERGAGSVARAVELALDWLDDPERAAQVLEDHGARLPGPLLARETGRVAVRRGRWTSALAALDPGSDHDVWAELGRSAWRAGEGTVAVRALRVAVVGAPTAALSALLAEVEAAVGRALAPHLVGLRSEDAEVVKAALTAAEAVDAHHPAVVEGRRRWRGLMEQAEKAQVEAEARAQAELREVAQREAWRLRSQALSDAAFDAAWAAAWLELPDALRETVTGPPAFVAFVRATGLPLGSSRGWCTDAVRFVEAESRWARGDPEGAEALLLAMDGRYARAVRDRVEVVRAAADAARAGRKVAAEARALQASLAEGQEETARLTTLVERDPAAYLRRSERDPARVARALAVARARLGWWSWAFDERSPLTFQQTLGYRHPVPARVVLADGRFITASHAAGVGYVVVRDASGHAVRGHAILGASEKVAVVGHQVWLVTDHLLIALNLDTHEPWAALDLATWLAEGDTPVGVVGWGARLFVQAFRTVVEQRRMVWLLFDPVLKRVVREERRFEAIFGCPGKALAVLQPTRFLVELTPEGEVDGDEYLGAGVEVEEAVPAPGDPGAWLLLGHPDAHKDRYGLFLTRRAKAPLLVNRVLSVAEGVVNGTMVTTGNRALVLSHEDGFRRGWWVSAGSAGWESTTFQTEGDYLAIANVDGSNVRLAAAGQRCVRLVDPGRLPELDVPLAADHPHPLNLAFRCMLVHDDPDPESSARLTRLAERLHDVAVPEPNLAELGGWSTMELATLASHWVRTGRARDAVAVLDLAEQKSPTTLTRRHLLHVRAIALTGLGRLAEAEETARHLSAVLRVMPGGIRCDDASVWAWIAVVRDSDPDGPDRTGGDRAKAGWRILREHLGTALRASEQGDHARALDHVALGQCGKAFARAIAAVVALRAPTATLEQRLKLCSVATDPFAPSEVVPGLDPGYSRRAIARACEAWMHAYTAFLGGNGPAPIGTAWAIEG